MPATGAIHLEDFHCRSRTVLLRLLSVVAGSDIALQPEMLVEIAAISIEGADPRWQIEQMELILDRWAREH